MTNFELSRKPSSAESIRGKLCSHLTAFEININKAAMKFEWGDKKNESNKEKHGIDFKKEYVFNS